VYIKNQEKNMSTRNTIFDVERPRAVNKTRTTLSVDESRVENSTGPTWMLRRYVHHLEYSSRRTKRSARPPGKTFRENTNHVLLIGIVVVYEITRNILLGALSVFRRSPRMSRDTNNVNRTRNESKQKTKKSFSTPVLNVDSNGVIFDIHYSLAGFSSRFYFLNNVCEIV